MGTGNFADAEPAHRPSSQAPVMWALSASLGWMRRVHMVGIG
ncbi:hypothetical protein ACNJQJ_22060, partial [Mycobacterium tuberculosis]